MIATFSWFVINLKTTQIEKEVDLKDKNINIKLDNLTVSIKKLEREQVSKTEEMNRGFDKLFDKLDKLNDEISDKYVTKENFHIAMEKDKK